MLMSKSRLEKFLYALYSLDSSDLPTPLSRIEELYKCLVTGEEPPTFEPLSRVEKYLMAILGVYDVDSLPNPLSRVEVLLYKLATGDDNLDDVKSFLSEHEELLAEIIRNGGAGGNIDIEYVLYTLSTEFNTLCNTAEKPVKSAILKGDTKYRDIDTGDILDTFDETKNLELVSVKMPVLTTTGKNLFDGALELGGLDTSTGLPNSAQTNRYRSVNYIKVKPNTSYIFSSNYNSTIGVREFNGGYEFLRWYSLDPNTNTFTTSENTHFIRFIIINTYSDNQIQLEEGSVATEYEPYKSNILTVNEDVELRGIGNVKDELNLLTGELTQRIGEIVLDGNMISGLYTSGQDGFISAFLEIPNIKNQPQYEEIGQTYIITNKFISTIFGWDMGFENISIHPTITDRMYLTLKLDTIGITTDMDREEKLRLFGKYLSENTLTVQYQLATESVKTVDLSTVNQDGNNTKLSTFDDITHVTLSSEGLIPEAELEVATKNEEVLNTMSLRMDDISTTQNALQETSNAQSENVDTTMIATTEIYEQLL